MVLALLLTLTLYACETDKSTIIVTFDTQGGEPLDPVVVLTVDDHRILPEAIRADSTFLYWSTEPSGDRFMGDFKTFGVSTITLYAVWQQDFYTITFVLGHGQEDLCERYQSNAYLVLPKPDVDGLMFIGWYLDTDYSAPFEDYVMPARDLTLYAHYHDQDTYDLSNLLMFDIQELTATSVTTDLVVRGHVGFIGYDITVYYDPNVLVLTGFSNGLANVVNDQNLGSISFNYVNVSKRIDHEILLISLSFDFLLDKMTMLSIVVSDMIDMDSEYKLFDVDSVTIHQILTPL